MGRALLRAHFAINAQVGDGTNFVRAKLSALGIFFQQVPQEVGLGTRAGGLARIGTVDGAHPLLGASCPTVSATIAMHAFRQHLARLPVQLPAYRRGGHRRHRPQRPGGLAGVWVHDFAGIEQAARVEDRFDLPEYWIERSVLARDPGRACQAGAMLRADRPLHIERQRMHLLGDCREPGDMLGDLQIEEGTCMDLPRGRVNQKRRGRIVLAENLLHFA